MKKLILGTTLILPAIAIMAQTKPAAKKPAAKPTGTAKPAAPKVVLKNITDSVGYALGCNIGASLKMQDMTKINTDMITRAINDVLSGKQMLMDDNTAFSILTGYSARMQEEKSRPTISQGEEFLAKNKLRPEVKTTATGLQYEVITEGTGIKPTSVDTFVAHYRGTLLDGTEFDASYNRNEPLTYPLSLVIPGWTEGLQLMSVGSKYKFYIPYKLGYGLHGSPPTIPGGAVLVFELELLDVKKKR